MQSAPTQNVIMLGDISNIERTDLKPYCLLLETKDKRYFLSLKNDEELYGWQDDVYSRSPLMGVSNPTNFVHKVHVGFDPVSGAFTVCSFGYSQRQCSDMGDRACPSNGANF
jgi:protein-serine/threonine kinase